jgi:hypothetical protein
LTDAPITPLCAFSAPSTWTAQDAHPSPVTGKLFLTRAAISDIFTKIMKNDA